MGERYMIKDERLFLNIIAQQNTSCQTYIQIIPYLRDFFYFLANSNEVH